MLSFISTYALSKSSFLEQIQSVENLLKNKQREDKLHGKPSKARQQSERK